jgi:hypothetical protein
MRRNLIAIQYLLLFLACLGVCSPEAAFARNGTFMFRFPGQQCTEFPYCEGIWQLIDAKALYGPALRQSYELRGL